MAIRGLNHVGVVVRDLEGVLAFFRALGFDITGPQEVEGVWLRRVAGVDAHHSEVYGVAVPGGDGTWLELARYSPDPGGEPTALPADAFGYRHIAYEVDDVDAIVTTARTAGFGVVSEVVDFGDAYRLAYVRGPEGLLVEFAQPLVNRS